MYRTYGITAGRMLICRLPVSVYKGADLSGSTRCSPAYTGVDLSVSAPIFYLKK